jgi:hypothetical protein
MVEIYSAHQTQQMSSPVPVDCPLETLDDLGRLVELAFLNGYIDPVPFSGAIPQPSWTLYFLVRLRL